jgi:spore coat protein U-like protein
MRVRSLPISAMLTALSALLVSFSVHAAPVSGPSATATSQFQVTLTLQAECKLTSASTLAFGTSGVIQTAITATSTINVQCTNTTPYNIGLNAGLGSGATVTTRTMTGGVGTAIAYQLFRDTARTQNWGITVGTDTLSGTGNGAVQPYTVYGSVPPQTTPAAGNYTDTVQVIVTY